MAYEYSHLESFPVVIAETTTGRRIHPSLFEGGTLPIDFVGPAERFTTISYTRVLLGHFPPGAFRGKTVIVGASSPILQDLHSTATTGSVEMAGPEIWANAVATLLRGVPLRGTPGWLNILLVVLLGVTVPVASLRIHRLGALLVAVGLAALFTVAVQLSFNSGRIITFVYPLVALAIATLGTLAVLYMSETLERERVRAVFSRFVNDSVVEQVLANADENLRLGGVERECTVLFSDLRGFTSFSESQPAAKVIEVVNYYLNEMTEAILNEGGTLIAYMGDGIMAVFGAPLEQDDHADRAVRAAREMIGPRLDHFNAWLTGQGFPSEFKMGVGLNTGPVMAGNVGSERRVEYTAIGDTTNTASRLEGMTKGHPEMLFMASSTRERLREPPDDLARVGEFEVRGRTATMEIWTLSPDESGEVPAEPPATGP
jgi:adenylate cyclase